MANSQQEQWQQQQPCTAGVSRAKGQPRNRPFFTRFLSFLICIFSGTHSAVKQVHKIGAYTQGEALHKKKKSQGTAGEVDYKQVFSL